MARIRSVWPSLWTDEAFLELSPTAKLFFIALQNECDDGGAFEWKPKQLKVRLFPADLIDPLAALAELERARFICRYEAAGAAFGAVRSFGKFQKPQKPTRVTPMPAEIRVYAMTEAVLTAEERRRQGTPADAGDPAPPPAAAPEPPSTQPAVVVEEPPRPDASTPDEAIRVALQDDYDSPTVALPSGEKRRGEGGEKEWGGVRSDPPQAGSVRPARSAADRDRPPRQPSRGTRIAPDWQPDTAGTLYAVGRGLDAERTAEAFRDHWLAAAGPTAAKHDWDAAWRTWCRKEVERRDAERRPDPRRRGADPEGAWGQIERGLGIPARGVSA